MITTSSHFILLHPFPSNSPSPRFLTGSSTPGGGVRAPPSTTMAGKRAAVSSRISSVFVLLLLVIFHLVTAASIDPEAEALINFKKSLKNADPALSNWDPSKSPCARWKGITCVKGHVFGIKLEGMGLSGVIDVEALGKLRRLRTMSFMNNAFDQSMPDLSKLGKLKNIYLSNNKFSGEILPSTFDGLKSLKKLHLANNALSGPIPDTLVALPKLVDLRLENNGFQGGIPVFEQASLKYLNVSYNQLAGQIPQPLQHHNSTAFAGNPELCGAPLEACSSKKNKNLSLTTIIIVAVLVALALAALLAVIIVLLCRRKKAPQQTDERAATVAAQPNGDLERGQGSSSPDTAGNKPAVRLTFLRDGGDRFDMTDLLKASAEVLGSGTFGSAYKAALNNGKVMVVKRIKQMNTVSREEFNEHMRRLGRLDHQNVLPILAFYYRKEEKLLVAEYVENVSLAVQLHGNKSKNEPTPDWPTRLNIIKGVAKGLQYLYVELPSLTAPHGHLKSSNVLLDASFKPLLTDYGLVPIMNQEHAEVNMISYKSPESKATGKITRKSDVWSLGILILEVLSGRSPWDTDVDLASWAAAAVDGGSGGAEVFDKDMAVGASQGEMMKLLKVGLSCCQADVDSRPEIKEVVEKLEEIREKDADDDFYSSYASEGDMRSSRGLSDDFKAINI